MKTTIPVYRMTILIDGKNIPGGVKEFATKDALDTAIDMNIVVHNGNKKQINGVYSKRIIIENALNQVEIIGEIIERKAP